MARQVFIQDMTGKDRRDRVGSPTPPWAWSHGRMPSVLLGLVVLVLTACGGDDLPADADDPWPLRVPVPGVIGYATVDTSAEDIGGWVSRLVGSKPLALADGRVVLLALDPLALGGAAGMVLPVADEEAFLASLELMPQVETLGNGRFRLRLAPDSGLAFAIAAYATFNAEPSALGMLGAVGGLGPQVLTVFVEARDGRAYIVPTFEAASSARRACAAIAGLEKPTALVLTLDTERAVTAHRDALENTRRRLLGLLGTAEGILSRHEVEDDTPAEDLRRRMAERARSILESVDIRSGDILGMQWRAAPSDPDISGRDPLDVFEDLVRAQEFRFAWSESSQLGRILEAMDPVPADLEATFLMRLDPRALEGALDLGFDTLLELFAGMTPETGAALGSVLEDVLDRMDGLIAVPRPSDAEGAVLIFSLRPGATFDGAALARSFAEALPEVDAGEIEVLSMAEGAYVIREADGSRLATLGESAGMAWVGDGERIRPPSDACAALAARARELPDEGPVLLLDTDLLRLGMRVQGRQATLDIRLWGEADDGR